MRPVEIFGVGYMGDELVTTGLSAGGGVRAATGLYLSVIRRLRRWLASARRNINKMMQVAAIEDLGIRSRRMIATPNARLAHVVDHQELLRGLTDGTGFQGR